MSDPRGRRVGMAKPAQLSFGDARPAREKRAGPGVDLRAGPGAGVRAGLAVCVLPDAARVEERLARLASRGSGIVVGRQACTLAYLERELVREARKRGLCPAPAPPHALALLLRDLSRELIPAGSAFHAIRGEPGFAKAAGDLLAALSQGLLEPKELLELQLPSPTQERVAPLARLLAEVRRTLDAAGLAEPHRALRLTVEALESGDAALPPFAAAAAELTFDSILDWTPLRIRLASALSVRLSAIGGRVRVRLPWFAGRPELTEALEPTLRAFEALGAAGPELLLANAAEGSPLEPFLSRLFGAEDRTRLESAPLLLRSCASPAAQAREAARTCKDLLALGGAPDGIAIAARSLGGGVAEELAAALERLGLPWRERRGRPALPAPPVQLALRILELAERDFPREELEALLSSRLLWLREEGERFPSQVLVRRLREAHVRDDAADRKEGRGGISARLLALEARLRARAEAKGVSDERALLEVQETRRRAQRLIDDVRGLPERATLREHGRALLDLLRRFGLERRLRRGSDAPGPPESADEDTAPPALARAAAAALARDQAALRALEEACEGLARAAAALSLETRLHARAEWAQILATALAAASLPPGGARGGAIQLVELRELPGRSFAHLLVTGLVDGELPARPSPDPLLSDDDRRAINRASKRAVFRAPSSGVEDAGVLPPRQAEEPLLFHLGLCAATESATLFWQRADGQGREVLRSPFVDEAVRALGLPAGAGSAAKEGDPWRAPLAPIPAAVDCRSGAELLARAALEAFAEPAWRVSPPGNEDDARALFSALAASPLAPRLRRAARAALAERERLRVFVGEIPPGRYSGQLGGRALELVSAALRFGPDAPLSAHQLEENATCAFKTLGHRILRLEKDTEGEDDLAARERGKLLHRCLESYFQRLRREDRLPLGQALEAELATLREVAAAEMEAFAREEHVGHRVLWELRRRDVLRTLEALIESEGSEEGRENQPLEFERKFGFANEGSAPGSAAGSEASSWEGLQLPSPDGGAALWVRGVIDRIDRAADGSLTVLDYKSGTAYPLQRKLKGQSLFHPEHQLALYAALLQQREPGRRIDAGYISLKEAKRTRRLRGMLGDDGIELDALLEMDPARRALLRAQEPVPPNLADDVHARISRMRSGRFRVLSLNCDYCDLKTCCRVVALPTDPEENGGEVPRV